MPRTPELIQHFGVHKTRTTTSQYPLATIGLLLSVGTSMVLDYQFGPHDPGENKTCYPLYENLCPDDLLLADRGFAGSPTLARVIKTGASFLMRKNARLIVSKLPVLQRLGKHDFITEIPMNKPARKKDPTLPETVRVRIFRASWETPAGEKVTEWFVTSLMDSKRFKKKTLAKLYHERWQVETSYLEIKQIFHADVLRSKKVENVYKEFSAHVLAYQLLRIIINSAAKKHEKKPTQISVINTARWVMSFSHRMAASPAWALPIMYERLLDAIASTQIDVRPGRLEPRMRCRELKHYPRLKTSRAEWRKKRILRSA